MAAVGLLHGVHAEGADGVDGELGDVGSHAENLSLECAEKAVIWLSKI
jgi:hypothetical protein